MRTGQGHDVHRLVEERKFMLGGVDIPYEKGLLGHSNAGILSHAISDTLLGVVMLSDISAHFSDSDSAYSGADSVELLCAVENLIRVASYEIRNIDSMVVCQAPRLVPRTDAMRTRITEVLALSMGAVSTKANSEEHIGSTSRGEGITAHVVCLLTERTK